MNRKPYHSGLKPGDVVVIIDCSEVVLLEGKSGGFDTSRLRKVG